MFNKHFFREWSFRQVALLACLAAVAVASSSAHAATIRGSVSTERGKPIGRANVTIEPVSRTDGGGAVQSAVTDAEGRFEFKNVRRLGFAR